MGYHHQCRCQKSWFQAKLRATDRFFEGLAALILHRRYLRRVYAFMCASAHVIYLRTCVRACQTWYAFNMTNVQPGGGLRRRRADRTAQYVIRCILPRKRVTSMNKSNSLLRTESSNRTHLPCELDWRSACSPARCCGLRPALEHQHAHNKATYTTASVPTFECRTKL